MDFQRKRDARFADGGVFFLPWIGRRYDEGFLNQRLLVLGESHYSEWEGQIHKLNCYSTRECIAEVLERKNGARFWPSLEQAMVNQTRTDGWASKGKAIWNAIAFYNFVQSPVSGGARVSPRPEQFRQSLVPFRTVIEELKPNRIVVCGMRLWSNMEDVGDANDYLHDRVQRYHLNDSDRSEVWCLAINHPSSAFSWVRWHQIISAFLVDPNHAASLLSRTKN